MKQNDQATFSEIFEINGILEKLPREFTKAKDALSNGEYYKYVKKLIDTTLSLEKITLRARRLANISFKRKNMPLEYDKLVSKIADEAQKISIEIDNNITKITIPNTLPHYKDSFKSVLIEPLNYKLKGMAKSNLLPNYSQVVFVIINEVSQNTNKKIIRDNDNYDYKQVINTVAYWTLSDDGFNCCSMYNGTKIGEQDLTHIYIVPKSFFSDWYNQNLSDL